MAKLNNYRLEFVGAVEVEANKEYTSTEIVSMGADTIIMKTRANIDSPITVSVNKTPAFPISYDETTVIDENNVNTYVFNKDCILAIANNLDLV